MVSTSLLVNAVALVVADGQHLWVMSWSFWCQGQKERESALVVQE